MHRLGAERGSADGPVLALFRIGRIRVADAVVRFAEHSLTRSDVYVPTVVLDAHRAANDDGDLVEVRRPNTVLPTIEIFPTCMNTQLMQFSLSRRVDSASALSGAGTP